MNRYLVLSLLTYGLIIIALATFNGPLLALGLPLVVYLASGLLLGPRQLNLEVVRRLSAERIAAGEPVTVTLTVTNQGADLEEVHLVDQLPGDLELVDGDSDLRLSLPQGGHAQLQYTVRGSRGRYHFERMQAIACDRLGVWTRRAEFDASGQILILPQLLRLRHVAIRPRQTRSYSGTILSRQGGPGLDFFGVRSYQDGDSLRHINWRASARHEERLYTTEFERERVAEVCLILDGRERSNLHVPHGSLFEHSVVATAALAQSLLAAGNRLSLLVYGAFLDWTYPGYGKVQSERILRALARAEAGNSLVFDKLENLPTRMVPVASQIIVVSPLVSDDIPTMIRLRARGYQVMVVSPDPVSFEAQAVDGLPHAELSISIVRIERKLMIRRLRHAGIHVLNWEVSVPFDKAMHLLLRRLPPWFQPKGVRL